MSALSRPSSSAGKANGSSSSKTLNEYQLGDSLGKGAFGQVYRGLNWATGETVAVKEIQMSNIPKAELGEIMAEINLLKNLNHENIVKYKGFVKTRDYLYIILEFCENGSLHSIIKKFGKFPESLVAVYICQVLEGLVYLHDQGVIHRDIKGANILTNKDGTVKLADFGVASSTTTSDDAVVGSPYWMAPEVIEQSGATTASDVWSVGCVVIELLEGQPPYHFLDPMPALFRIVQDDCPPIPEGASPIVKDFLYHCFQKDCNLRISAKKLLKHPWMAAARKQLQSGRSKAADDDDTITSSDAGAANAATGDGSAKKRPVSNYNYDEAVLKVQEWNEALKSPSKPSKHPSRNNQPRAVSPLGRPFSDQLPSLTSSTSSVFTPTRPMARDQSGGMPGSAWKLGGPMSGVGVTVGVTGGKLPPGIIQPLNLAAPEPQTDNWDEDFEEGISFTKLQSREKAPAEDEKHETDDNAQTIRPSKSPRTSSAPLARPPSADISSIVEDYSDLASDEDEGWLEEKVADFKMKNAKTGRRGLFHPDDIKVFGLDSGGPGPLSAPLPGFGFIGAHKKASRSALSLLNMPSGLSSGPPSASSSIKGSHARSSSMTAAINGGGSSGSSAAGSFGKAESQRVNGSEFEKYTESEDEDYEDVFGKPNAATAGPGMQALQLNTRLSSKSWLAGDDSDEEDPFAEIDEGFSEDDLESNLQRDKYARLCTTVNQLIDELTPSAADSQLRNACEQLLTILNETPEMQLQFVNFHGMLVILEVLEGRWSRDVTMKLLQIINLLVTSELAFLESFCLIGGIPVMMEFTSKKYPSEYRLEASSFIRLLYHTSVMTLQMFIACRGLKVLVDLLDEDYTEQTDLVIGALNGIVNVFELQSPTSKNDFCRMFIREGLLDPLSCALLNVTKLNNNDISKPSTRFEMKTKTIQVLLIFAQVSQSDIHVRNALGTRKVVRRLMRACEMLEPECLVHLLRAIKHLSMNATIHEVLQNANALEILIRILDEQGSGAQSTEISNHIFQTCYNLCRLNKSRQEEAAQAGIMPCLKRVIETSSPLRQFALPILCDLASAGKSCRTLLWQHDGLRMYLKLLEDPYFQVSALEAIVSWIQDETSRVEDELTKPVSLDSLIRCFVNSKANSFENLLDGFLKLTRLSTPITICLAKSPPFFRRIIDRLLGRSSSTVTSNQNSNQSQSHSRKDSASSTASNPNTSTNLGVGKAVVRLNLLRILRTICEVHPNRGVLVERYGLLGVVERLSKYDPAVLVRELAREIIPVLRPGLRPVAAFAQAVTSGSAGPNADAGADADISLADDSFSSGNDSLDSISGMSDFTGSSSSTATVTMTNAGPGSVSMSSLGMTAARLRSGSSAGSGLGEGSVGLSGRRSVLGGERAPSRLDRERAPSRLDREKAPSRLGSASGSESGRGARKLGLGGAGGLVDGLMRNVRGMNGGGSASASGGGPSPVQEGLAPGGKGLIGSSSSATPKHIVPKKMRRASSETSVTPIGMKRRTSLIGGGREGDAGARPTPTRDVDRDNGVGASGTPGRSISSMNAPQAALRDRDSVSGSRLHVPPPVPPLPLPSEMGMGMAHRRETVSGDEVFNPPSRLSGRGGDVSMTGGGGGVGNGSFGAGKGRDSIRGVERVQQQQQPQPQPQATKAGSRKARQRLGDIPWQGPSGQGQNQNQGDGADGGGGDVSMESLRSQRSASRQAGSVFERWRF